MDFTTLLTHLEAGDTEKALEVAKALKPKFEQTVQDLKDADGKLSDAISTRDTAKEKIKTLAGVFGVNADELTPDKAKEILSSKSKDDGNKAEIESLTKLLEEKDVELNNRLNESEMRFKNKMVEIEIAKSGILNEIVNDEDIISATISKLSKGAIIEDGEVVYKGEDGAKLRGSDGRPLDVGGMIELFKQDPKNANKLLATSKGGGGASGNASVAGGKKFSEMSGAEKVALHRSDPAEYNRLKELDNKDK